MRFLLNSIGVQVIILIFFTLLYYSLPTGHFKQDDIIKELTIFDCFNLSTTIQAGVGLIQIVPVTPIAQSTMTLQQLFLIIGNISILNNLIYYL